MPKGTVVINEDRCKGCELCTSYCPSHCLEMSTGFNAQGHHPVTLAIPEKCTGCAICGWMCPDCAIEVFKEAVGLSPSRPSRPRPAAVDPVGEGRA